MKKTKLITFTEIKQWTILGVLIFIFGGGLIFIPDFSFGSIGGQLPSDRNQQSFKNYTGLSLLTPKEKEKLYKYVVENQYHVKPYDLKTSYNDMIEKYNKKQSDVQKDFIVENFNNSIKKVKPSYKKSGAKDNVADKLPPDPTIDPKNKMKMAQKMQEKTPPENGEKSDCDARGENPTAASEEGSSCKSGQIQINNFGGALAYMNFCMYDGSCIEANLCEDYPDKCGNSVASVDELGESWVFINSTHAKGKEFIGGAQWLSSYREKWKTRAGNQLRKMENVLNEGLRQERNTENEIRKSMQQKSYNTAEKKKQELMDSVMKASAKDHEKNGNAGPQAGKYHRKGVQNTEVNPDNVGGKSGA